MDFYSNERQGRARTYVPVDAGLVVTLDVDPTQRVDNGARAGGNGEDVAGDVVEYRAGGELSRRSGDEAGDHAEGEEQGGFDLHAGSAGHLCQRVGFPEERKRLTREVALLFESRCAEEAKSSGSVR